MSILDKITKWIWHFFAMLCMKQPLELAAPKTKNWYTMIKDVSLFCVATIFLVFLICILIPFLVSIAFVSLFTILWESKLKKSKANQNDTYTFFCSGH